MKATVVKLEGLRKVVFHNEVLNRAALSANDVMAETLYSAISVGTELAAYRGDPPLRPGPVYPRLVGYCNVASIVATGPAVSQFQVGDHILTLQSHRSAFICPVDKVIAKVPVDVDLMEAATTYLFQLGYNALLKGSFVAGQRVAVIGLGTLGLATVALVHALGGFASGFSAREAARALASEFGAHAVSAKDHLSSTYDLVVSTSNSWTDWRLALQLARKDGTVCVLGFPGRTSPIPDYNPLDSQFFYDKQLRLVACGPEPLDGHFTVKGNCAFLLNLLRQGKLPARRMISGVEAWANLAEVYARLEQGTSPNLTWILKWK